MSNHWKTIRIFISSTFRDMHAERDLLVRFVFPELKEKCRKHHIHLIDVDLRWGVTEQDAQDGKALDMCLDEIDSCRPFFICLLGHRYGWVPTGKEHSITASEIYHAVLHDKMPSQVVNLRKILEGRLEGKKLSVEQINTMDKCFQWDGDKQKYLLQQNISDEERMIIRSVFKHYSAYQRDRSFFFFRCEALTMELAKEKPDDFFESDPDTVKKLEDLKEEIKNEGLWWTEYDHLDARDEQDTNAFTEKVTNILWGRIEKVINTLREEPEKDWLEQEAEFHELFIEDRTRRFVGRRDVLDQMHEFCEEDDSSNILVIKGEPGCGKSALMGRFTTEVQHKHPEWLIIPHFVGASPISTSLRQILKRICETMFRVCDFESEKRDKLDQIAGNDENAQKQRDDVENEYDIPEDSQKLRKTFVRFLKKGSLKKRILLILDAVNQMELIDNAHGMHWLPWRMPENIKVVASTLAGEALEALQKRSDLPKTIILKGLDKTSIRLLVREYLKEIRKNFPNPKIEASFLDKIKAGHPLYILVALEELRVFGQFDELGPRINKLPKTVDALFDQVLMRIETDCSVDLVKDCLSLIACGRQGMTAAELQDLLKHRAAKKDAQKLPDMTWARLYRSFGTYLFERSGVIDFFHNQLKEAVGRRYLPEERNRRECHHTIANYFAGRWQEPYSRALDGLPWQRIEAKDWGAVEEILTDIDFIETKCRNGLAVDLVADYNAAQVAHPEAQAESEKEHLRREYIWRWTREIIEYARKWSEARDRYIRDQAYFPMPTLNDIPLPKSPPLVEIKSEKHDQEIKNEDQWTPLERIRAWQHFVINHLSLLPRHESPAFQWAYNSATNGPVATDMRKRLSQANGPIGPWISHMNPPSYTPQNISQKTLSGELLSSMAATPDGKRAISGGMNGELCLWDLERCVLLRTLSGHKGEVTSISITPEGRLAVSSGIDKRLRLWDLQTGDCIRILEGHNDSINAVSVTPDGRWAISGSTDRTLKFWDLENGACLKTLDGFSKINAVAITPDGGRAVSGDDPHFGELRIWDLDKGVCLKVLGGEWTSPFQRKPGHVGPVQAIALIPNGKYAVSGGGDQRLLLWDLEAGEYRELSETSTTSVFNTVAITPDGLKAVAGTGIIIRLYDLKTCECIKTLAGHTSDVVDLVVTPDGRQAVSISGSSDSTVRVWDLTGPDDPPPKIQYKPSQIKVVKFSPDGRKTIFGVEDTLFMIDLESGQLRNEFKGHHGYVEGIEFVPESRNAISWSSGSIIDEGPRLWDTESGDCLKVLKGNHSVRAIVVTPDGQRAICSADIAVVLNIETNSIEHKFYRIEPRNVVSLTPDGRCMLSGKEDKVCMWDLETGEVIRELKEHKMNLKAIAVAPDGHRIIIGSGDGKALVWDLHTDECMVVPDQHPGPVHTAIVTPDGRKFISAGSGLNYANQRGNETLRVWDLATGACLTSLEGHFSRVTGLETTIDGRFLLSASYDETMRLWDLDNGKCMSLYYSKNGGISRLALNDMSVLVGTVAAKIDYLLLRNLSNSPAVTTPIRLWLFGREKGAGHWDSQFTNICGWCRKRAATPQPILDAICGIYRSCGTKAANSSCQKLPVEAWDEPVLFSKCPQCHKSIRFNPFIVDNRGWY